MVTSNINQIIKEMGEFEKKQLPYALMLTSNNLAFEVMNSMKKEFATELHIGKKSVISSVRVRKATKLKPYAEVYVDEFSWQHKVLQHHFYGGDRDRKGLEKALIYFGYMHKWEILTPPPGVKIRPSTYVQILSQLKLDYKAGYNSNETKRSRLRKTANKKSKARYFLITGKSTSPLAPGIYARMPGHDKPISILRIAEKPTYKKKFDFNKTANEVYAKKSDELFKRALEYAMFTAK